MDDLIQVVRDAYQNNQSENSEWQISRIATGMNGLVFHAVSAQADLAVKISKRDERDRAGREYATLTALRDFGIAPCPVALYRDVEELPGDVLVSSWIDGEFLSKAPAAEDRAVWKMLSDTLAAAHSLNPAHRQLQPAVWNVQHPTDVVEQIRRFYLPQLPEETVGLTSRAELGKSLIHLSKQFPAYWENAPQLGLILCDCNPGNIIRVDDGFRLVDWENSGWADPAFEIGDMAAHAGYFDLPLEHWAWFFEEHARRLNDPTLPQRAEVYRKLMLLFWVVIMTRGLAKSGATRLSGVKIYPPEHYARYQQVYWERLNPAM